jgi:hypothetical protein
VSAALLVREPTATRPQLRVPWDHRALFAAVALGVAIGGGAALQLPAGSLRLLLVVAFDIVGPGAALMAHVRVRDTLVAWALAVTASLSVMSLPATVMLWLGEWQPLSVHIALLAATLCAASVRLIIAARARPRLAGSQDARARPRSAVGWRGRAAASVTPALLVTGVALWAVAVATTTAAEVGPYGLTVALGVPFIVAVVAVCLAFAGELLRRSRPLVLTAGIAAITVMLRASAPLLLAEVQYPWTYKHFGVVELLRQAGRILDPADIYQSWPAFFAGAAQLSDVSGVAPVNYATWSSLVFSLIDVLLLAAAVRVAIDATPLSSRQTTGHYGLRGHRIVFLTAFLFAACLWVDTNYFSPQAYAFALSLGFFVILRTWLYRQPPGGRLRFLTWRRRPRAAAAPQGGWLWPTLAITGVFFVITASHQLSPYLILAAIATLGALGRLRSRMIVVLLCGVAFGYLAPRLGGIASDYGLFSGFNLFQNAAGNASSWGSDAQRVSALIARGLAVSVWGGGLLALWKYRRQPNAITVGIMAFSPFVILGAQSYGGEAIYRVFLFSLPWCALLIAMWLVRCSSPATGLLKSLRPRTGAMAGVALALSLCSLAAHQGLQGQFAVHAVTTADLDAARYFAAHAPDGSSLLLGAQNFPSRLTGNYDRFNIGIPLEPALTDQEHFRDATLDASWQPAVEEWVSGYAGTRTYLVVSDRMVADAEYFGNLRTGALQTLEAQLRASRRWKIFYEGPGVTIFEQQTAF